MRRDSGDSSSDILNLMEGIGWRMVCGLLIVAYVVIIVRQIRRPRADMPSVLMFVGVAVTMVPQVITLTAVAHKRTVLVGCAIIALGIWRTYRSRRALTMRPTGDKQP